MADLKWVSFWSAGSSPAARTLLIGLALAGCGDAADTGPVLVSAIGGRPTLTNPDQRMPDTPSRLLTDAVAQGLVRFDATGQIEPGLAERWIVTGTGASYIFRLRDGRWADGAAVTAMQVAASLKRQITRGSRNSLAPFLTAIDEIVVMTPQVIEVRLKRPRPDLLKLFAQPEFAIVRSGRAAGSGPLQPIAGGATPLLRRVPDPVQPGDDAPSNSIDPGIRLTGERAAAAIIRFIEQKADLVSGGTFADWPLVFAAQVPARAIRTDPAAGLFGLSIVSREGFLADAGNRAAIAQSIDGPRTLATIAPNWPADTHLLPDSLDSAAPPQGPDWATHPLDERQSTARARVAGWVGGSVRLRIALPNGPGATGLWGQLASSLLAIGITPVRVPLAAPAELRLLDAVAPYDSARWYLAMACQPCSAEPFASIQAARDAPTLAERSRLLAKADAALAQDVSFIPLGRPYRWSLVSPRLNEWQPNARAWHPLNRLRIDPKS